MKKIKCTCGFELYPYGRGGHRQDCPMVSDYLDRKIYSDRLKMASEFSERANLYNLILNEFLKDNLQTYDPTYDII